jgi:hypothetical protein
MSAYKEVFIEDNVVSLRTAAISDNGDFVIFRLTPAWLETAIPGSWPRGTDWVSQDRVWLYRHLRSPAEEVKLARGIPCVQHNILAREAASEFKLLWSDSGHGVAIYVDGEPWGFTDERTHKGYSKGILRRMSSKTMTSAWNQELFEKLFGEKGT